VPAALFPVANPQGEGYQRLGFYFISMETLLGMAAKKLPRELLLDF
jgi:hypothetical protein